MQTHTQMLQCANKAKKLELHILAKIQISLADAIVLGHGQGFSYDLWYFLLNFNLNVNCLSTAGTTFIVTFVI